MNIPKEFDVLLNLKKAALNGLAVVLLLLLGFSIHTPLILVLGFTFGILGGSANDIVSFMSNKDAIVAHAALNNGGQ